MLKTELLKDGTLIKTYSDAGMLIERDGVRYCEAIDPADAGREYIETDEPIEKPEEPEMDDDEAYAEAGKILLGVDE
jgi:hypothetical protein